MATCTLNGETVPCDQMPEWFQFMVSPTFIMSFWSIFVLVMIVVVGFWFWMIVDVVKCEKEKPLWLILLFVTGGFGAIIYYFVRKRKR